MAVLAMLGAAMVALPATAALADTRGSAPNLVLDCGASRDIPSQWNVVPRHIRDLLARNWNRPIVGQARVRINTVGFFFESPDVGAFLWALARENDGSFVGMSKP
jgi:hypothetical protein